MTNEIRTPYNQRSTWMQEVHRTYGKSCHLQDIDSLNDMWIENNSGELAALAEFKQDYESIELYKYKAMKTLADNSKIPFYIVVGYKEHMAYYIIPMNDYAKAVPHLDKPRFFSETNYIRFLHYIRKIKIDESILEGKNSKYPKGLPLPNIKG